MYIHKKQLLLVFAVLWLPLVSLATDRKEEVEVSKKVEVDFAADPNIKIELVNKYGFLNVQTWDKNEVQMVAEIVAKGKDRQQAEKMLERIEIDYQESSRYFYAETKQSKEKSSPALITSFMNMLSDTKSSLVNDKNNVRVNYRLFVPKGARLDLENKFGDVILGTYENKVSVNLSHGNLRAESLGQTDITLSFGEGQIKTADDLSLETKFAKLFVDQSKEIRWKGISSELSLVEVQKLELIESRKDEIKVQAVDEISGNSHFSKIKLGQIKNAIRLNTEFGALEIEQLAINFSEINLVMRSTDLEVLLPRQSSYQLDLTAPDDRLSFPDIWQQFLGDEDPLTLNEAKENIRTIRGKIGETGKSRVQIQAEGGHLYIQD